MAKNQGTPRAPRVRYHYQKHPHFDFFLQWLQGAQTHGAAEGGECFYAASRIPGGDQAAWRREWEALSERVLARAETSESGGHLVSARESYLRAYSYLRATLVFVSPVHELDRFLATYERARSYFLKAARLFDPPIEAMSVPYAGKELPAYFRPASGVGRKAPTLLMIGGGDTFVEDLYAYIGPAAAKRGYNFACADLPGQGTLPNEGLVWEAEAERSVGAVLDALRTLPSVDPDQIAVYGISGGGYLAPRAAAYDGRIAACAACSVVLDFSGVWSRPLIDLWSKAARSLPHRLLRSAIERRYPWLITLLDAYRWRVGAASVAELIDATASCTFDPALIRCPFLNISSEQELRDSPSFRAWAEEAAAKAPHPANRSVIMPADEGADTHSIGSNLSLMSQTLFDWLDEVLAPKSA